ncbi:hypothetical protein CB1_000632048 [Camelus ferus]|nr:hypothetical protein CB1_000632048 [Camelus ferus]
MWTAAAQNLVFEKEHPVSCRQENINQILGFDLPALNPWSKFLEANIYQLGLQQENPRSPRPRDESQLWVLSCGATRDEFSQFELLMTNKGHLSSICTQGPLGPLLAIVGDQPGAGVGPLGLQQPELSQLPKHGAPERTVQTPPAVEELERRLLEARHRQLPPEVLVPNLSRPRPARYTCAPPEARRDCSS